MARMQIQEGDIIYHKLTGQPMMSIENQDMDIDAVEDIDCRYMDNMGVYHAEAFYLFELMTERPEAKKAKKTK